MPEEFAAVAIPNDKVAPNLAKRGIYAVRYAALDVVDVVLQHGDPVVGGYTPEKVALRRAIALAVDNAEEIRLRAARPGHPGAVGHRRRASATTRASRSEMGDYDPPRARALLDLYGYVDRDGDGWREQPDGSPLVLAYATAARRPAPPARRAVEEEHGRDRRAHRLQRSRSGPRT